jgi:hypothetical protein
MKFSHCIWNLYKYPFHLVSDLQLKNKKNNLSESNAGEEGQNHKR